MGWSSGRGQTAPRGSGEWIAGSRPAPFHVMEPVRFRPRVALVMDAASGWVFGVEALAHGSGRDETAGAVVKIIEARSPAGEPGALPRSLRVDDPELAGALRSRLGSRVTVRLGPTPELDGVMLAMARDLGPGDDRQRYLEDGRVAPEVVTRFFEAAAAVYRLAPWRTAQGDSQVLRVDAPAFGVQGACLSIIGGLGENYGVLLFDSVEDFSEMARAGAESAAQDRGAGVPILSINFDKRKALPPGLAREAKEKGWAVAGPGAYPWILSVDADGLARPLAERDYAFATALLDSLAVFLREHARVFEDDAPDQITETVVVESLPDRPAVTLTAPHPDADWDWLGGDPLAAARWDEAEGLAGRFVADHVRRGRGTEWLQGAQSALDDVLRFKIETMGEAPLGWTPGTIEEYLLEYFPGESAIPPEEAGSVPEYLEAFFAWLAEAGLEEPATARQIEERIARRRGTFLERARRPAPAGSPRHLAEEIRKSGIDPSDEAAVAAFISQWASRVAKGPLPRPAGSGKRWQWTPGSPPPEPAAPCPCGSGVRYRKCCMPR